MTEQLLDYTGKVVLITDASGNIGRATALAFVVVAASSFVSRPERRAHSFGLRARACG